MRPENALIERVVVRRTDDMVVLREVWDMTHPECPFVSWKPRERYGREIEMRPEEYDQIKPILKDREGT